MKTNVGAIDKSIRIGVGLLLIILTLIGTIGWWGWIGIVPLVTGFMGSCPAYALLGLSTCPLQNQSSEPPSGPQSSTR